MQADRQADTPHEYTHLNSSARNGQGNQPRERLVTSVTSPAHTKNDPQPVADKEWVRTSFFSP